jgi:anti-sigma regulatory factor (Ser/Thr protein kinase)
VSDAAARSGRVQAAFRHEAVLYAGLDQFVDATVPFIAEGVADDAAVLVVVSHAKIERLRAELGDDAGEVHFADMAVVGQNPACLIPAWREFIDDNDSGRRAVRGVGEPVWAGRTDDELVECQRHESLLNYAFGASGGLQMLCPYDTRALPAREIGAARATHPHVVEAGRSGASSTYRDDAAEPFDRPLPAPPASAAAFPFDATMLEDARHFVADYAAEHDLLQGRSEELAVAVGELVTNSVRHGGGAGVVRVWHDHGRLVCEVSDKGWLRNPLAGRVRPSTEREEGRGLWMVNHLCDLVQIRSSPAGTVVRVLMG